MDGGSPLAAAVAIAREEFTDLPRAADRLVGLCEAAFALSGAATEQAVAEAVVTRGVDALGASAGTLALRNGAVLRLLAARGYARDLVSASSELPLDAPLPLTECVRTGRAVWIENVAALEARYPHLAPLRQDTENRAFAALPLLLDGRLIGALGLSFAEERGERAFPAEDRAYALILAHHAAVALDRARRCEAEEIQSQRLVAALETRTRFLNVAAHELNTPLTVLLGHAQLLLRHLSLRLVPHVQLEASARQIMRSARRLSDVIAALLEMTHLGSASVAAAPAPIDVSAVLRRVRSRRRFAEMPVALDAPPALRARVDEALLERAIELLLENVQRHCPEGTPAELVARRAAGAPPVIEVVVRDHGPGIAPELRQRIFEPFTKGHETAASGLGVGLWVSRTIAELHGGSLDAAFPPGGGTAMVLRLPA